MEYVTAITGFLARFPTGVRVLIPGAIFIILLHLMFPELPRLFTVAPALGCLLLSVGLIGGRWHDGIVARQKEAEELKRREAAVASERAQREADAAAERALHEAAVIAERDRGESTRRYELDRILRALDGKPLAKAILLAAYRAGDEVAIELDDKAAVAELGQLAMAGFIRREGAGRWHLNRTAEVFARG